MSRISLRFAVICLVVARFASGTHALAQAPQETLRQEPRLTVTVETFCSDTKLRTSNARIRWSMPGEALETSGVRRFAAAKQTLEATVYKNGFEKGLLISVPISQTTPDHPIAALAQGKRSKLRAFQFSVIAIEQPKAALTAEGGAEMGVVAEGLEPGVNYTWRIAIDTALGRIVSAPSTSQAQVCPADLVPTTAVPRRKS